VSAGAAADERVLLDVAGVALRLTITERYVRRLVQERRIPFLKWGHFVRFDPDEIDRWLTTWRVPEHGSLDLPIRSRDNGARSA
jgi:excisionase family DNA binding protein